MKITHETISACPICAGRIRPLGLTERYNLQPFRASVEIRYEACEACGFVLQGNPVVGQSLQQYYADSPRYRVPEVSSTEARLCAEQAAFMSASRQLQGTRVLDIGADMGKMLDHLQSEYGCKTTYQEQNLTARAYLSSHGRHREAADARGSGPFDWIILSQVLEHIVRPVTFLDEMRSSLAPGGMLFVEVPNHSFWDDGDYGFSFEHVNYFSVAALTAALDRAGYVITRLVVCDDPRYFSGSGRVIRANAAVKDPRLATALPDVLREHNSRGMYGKFAAVERLGSEVYAQASPGLALYGAGELAEQLFAHSSLSPDQIAAVFDSDTRKHGRRFHDIAIHSPDDIVSLNPKTIVILSSSEADIRRTIEGTGYRGRVVGWSELVPAD